MKGISEIRVDQEIILPCEPKFSDTFPRLVQSYHPRDFNNSDLFFVDSNHLSKIGNKLINLELLNILNNINY